MDLTDMCFVYCFLLLYGRSIEKDGQYLYVSNRWIRDKQYNIGTITNERLDFLHYYAVNVRVRQ